MTDRLFGAVVSPYHLTSREAPALAALQLADFVVTLLPAPMHGRAGATVDADRTTAAAVEAPRYAELMDSWAWSAPLFREGVLGSAFAGEDAADDARHACDRIEDEPWLAGLRPLVRPELFDDDRTYLAAVARDVLKGGPDPALSIPLAAGLDAFAARHALMVARGAPASFVQKAEARLARRRASVVLPALVQASAERLLLARALLDDALVPLREGLGDLAASEGAPAELARAAERYADAFASEREDLLAPPGPNDDLDEVRPVEGTIALSVVDLPPDAVFTSSVSAAAMLTGPEARVSVPGAPTVPALPCTALIIKVLGRG